MIPALLAVSLVAAQGQSFHGMSCTKDCSGHIAGYQWAEKHGITNMGYCGGKSLSFIQGCMIYVKEHPVDAAADALYCSSVQNECHRRACEAASELEDAAQRLGACARRRDPDDSCDSQFRDARDAHDEYEDAVSNSSCDDLSD
jgi:hypothetical protein